MRGVSNILNYWRYLATRKLLVGGLFALAVTVTGGALLYQQPGTPAGAIDDCSSNSIIKCGADSVSELKRKYNNHGRGVKKIYAKFGINSTGDMSGLKNGYVTKSGKVVVDGKVVATNAKSSGRHNMSGSTRIQGIGNTKAYVRPTSVSFNASKIKAFVKMENGEFKWAILKPCGNPVEGKPKPPKEQPQPKEVEVCSPETGEIITVPENEADQYAPVDSPECQPEQPEAAYACTGLEAIRLDDTEDDGQQTYQFEVSYQAENGASLTSANFDFGNGDTEEVAATDNSGTITSQEVTYTEAGDKTIAATLVFDVNGEMKNVTDDACQTSITVPETPPPPTPPTPPEQPEVPSEVPETGPAQVIGGTLGAGSLVGAGYYFMSSRRNLFESVLKK